MPRKQKDVYERIKDTQNKITELEKQLKEQKAKLASFEKEKNNLEMHKMFEYAKEQNLQFEEVVKAINMFSLKTQTNNKTK